MQFIPLSFPEVFYLFIFQQNSIWDTPSVHVLFLILMLEGFLGIRMFLFLSLFQILYIYVISSTLLKMHFERTSLIFSSMVLTQWCVQKEMFRVSQAEEEKVVWYMYTEMTAL